MGACSTDDTFELDREQMKDVGKTAVSFICQSTSKSANFVYFQMRRQWGQLSLVFDWWVLIISHLGGRGWASAHNRVCAHPTAEKTETNKAEG